MGSYMSKFRILKTATYDKDYGKLDHAEQRRVDDIIDNLFDAGDVTGQPLGLPFFREKKFDGKRVLYLVYTQFSAILLLAITDKKAQQATINEILLHLDEYKQYVIQKLKEFI